MNKRNPFNHVWVLLKGPFLSNQRIYEYIKYEWINTDICAANDADYR